MQVRPASTVQLAYIISDPSDNNFYYIQAVVKNTQTQAIIATVKLTQDPNNSHRYTGNFVTPADSIGNGYYLDVTTQVYTDSGYSIPSQSYEIVGTPYFVWQPPPYYGGGDAVLLSDRSSKEIRKMIREEIAGIKFPVQKDVTIPEFPEIPVPEKVDLLPIHQRIDSVETLIQGLYEIVASIPEPEHVDLDPVFEHIKDIGKRHDMAMGALRAEFKSSLGAHKKEIDDSIEQKMSDGVEKLGDRLRESMAVTIPYSVIGQALEKKEEKKELTSQEKMRHLLSHRR